MVGPAPLQEGSQTPQEKVASNPRSLESVGTSPFGLSIDLARIARPVDLLRVQALAGNKATASLLAARAKPTHAPAVQRQKPPAPTVANSVKVLETTEPASKLD